MGLSNKKKAFCTLFVEIKYDYYMLFVLHISLLPVLCREEIMTVKMEKLTLKMLAAKGEF